jgi:predicted PolB exonuclease-like 3'-5' exonuclease
VEDARDARIRSLRSKGTLHAESGEIVTIGRKYNGDYRIPDGPEHEQLEEFWRAFTHHRNHGNILIGFNCHEFDMPWIVRRSLVHGVKIPAAVIDKDRYWHSCIVDLMKKWGMGCYGGIHKPSLHRLSLSMGGEGKSQDGRLLYELWDTSRDEAIAYVKHDLDLTEFCARRFGII